jgi:hypothetical protein
MSSFFPLAVLRRVSNDRFVKKFSECCCYTVKAENISAFHSNAATLYYFIYKINLVSHDYNPNSNFLSSSKTWFHNMEVFFRRLNNFSNSSAQTATPSPAEMLPPPANPTPPSTDQPPSSAHAHAARLLRWFTTAAPANGIRKNHSSTGVIADQRGIRWQDHWLVPAGPAKKRKKKFDVCFGEEEP